MLTPYVECLISNVRWSPYTEKQSPVTYKISENRENLLEKSIALKTKCELTEHSQLQTWIVGSSGLKKTNSLSSNSMITPLFKYTISAPSYKKKYTKPKGGLSYEVQLSLTLTLGVDGILSFEKIKKNWKETTYVPSFQLLLLIKLLLTHSIKSKRGVFLGIHLS